jgi:hypothetical protein
MGDLFGVELAPHNRWAGAKVLRDRWQAHIDASLSRPVLIVDEAQEMKPAVLAELRLLSSAASWTRPDVDAPKAACADYKLALNAGWDRDILAIELQALVDIDFDVELTGFSLTEVDLVLDEAAESSPAGRSGPEDEILPVAPPRHSSDAPRRCLDRRPA